VRVRRYCGFYKVREKTADSVTKYYRYYSTYGLFAVKIVDVNVSLVGSSFNELLGSAF